MLKENVEYFMFLSLPDSDLTSDLFADQVPEPPQIKVCDHWFLGVLHLRLCIELPAPPALKKYAQFTST